MLGALSETQNSEGNPYCYPRYYQIGTIRNSIHLPGEWLTITSNASKIKDILKKWEWIRCLLWPFPADLLSATSLQCCRAHAPSSVPSCALAGAWGAAGLVPTPGCAGTGGSTAHPNREHPLVWWLWEGTGTEALCHSHCLKKSLSPGLFSWEAKKPQRKGKQ